MGRVMRSAEQGPAAGRLIKADVLTAKEQAARLLVQAHEEAGRLIEAATLTATQLRSQALAEGMCAGREQGAAALTERLAQAEVMAARTIDSASSATIAIARRMAERIVGRTLIADPSLFVELAALALSRAQPSAGVVTLLVHPDDLAALDAERPRLVAELATTATLRIVADSEIGRHGCVVQTALGRIDARLQTQLEALERAVTARATVRV